MPFLRTPSRRRFIMPGFIALIALLIMYWGSLRKDRMNLEIQRHVVQLCDEAATGRNIADRLNNPNALVAAQTADEIKSAWPTSPMLSREVIVTVGDAKQFNLANATHTAMLRVSGRDVLGLRIQHKDEGGPIEILGYWLP